MKTKLCFIFCLFFTCLQVQFVQAAGPTIYDKSVPLEQSCTLVIQLCAITKFNGVNVNWNGLAGKKMVQIPAGQHNIQVYQKGVDYENTVDGTFTFLPEYIYVVYLGTYHQGMPFRLIGGPKPVGEIRQNDLVPDPESPDATPIEGMWELKKQGRVFIFAKNEFIVKIGGQNRFRGFFIFDGKTITTSVLYRYKNGKWVENFLGVETMEYSGQKIRAYGNTFEKM